MFYPLDSECNCEVPQEEPVTRSPRTRPRTVSRSVVSRMSANATPASEVPTCTAGFSFQASVYAPLVSLLTAACAGRRDIVVGAIPDMLADNTNAVSSADSCCYRKE
jgi:hypothetical protein